MKKKYIQVLLPIVFAIAAGFVVIKFNKNEKNKEDVVYLLKDRRGPLAQTAEWKEVQTRFENLMKIARTNPDDIKSRLSLAALYIQEARTTGEHGYYDMAAMKYAVEVLDKDPNNFEALIYKALVYLSQHHFAEGLAIAKKARDMNPDNAFVYGILTDANVELGDYTAAIENADKMVSIRPDIRSYSRISYLREIHGDYEGAIDAMRLAVIAGAPGDEATEWCRVQQGRLYEYAGKPDSAAYCYMTSLQNRPYYAYAIAGQGRLSMKNKEYAKAASYFLQADSLVHDNSFKEELLDIYQTTNQQQKAKEIADYLLHIMNKEANSKDENDNMGHYADRELAILYLKIGDTDKALEHALIEYKRRPKNIDVNETLAWVYYKKGQAEKAVPYLNEALRTHSKNPGLLKKASLIYAVKVSN